MSQEGANLPQEVERSHDQATNPHDSIPTGVGSPMATVMPADAGLFTHAISAVLSTGDGSNSASEITSPVPQAGEDNNTKPKITSPAVHLAGDENKAEFKLGSPAVLLADEEKTNNAPGLKFASLVMLHDCNNSKDGSHAGMDNNATQSKLTSQAVLHVVDGNNGRSKIASSAFPQAIMNNTTSSKLDSTVPHAGKDKNSRFTNTNPAVLDANMDNKAERPKFASPMMLHVGKDHKSRTKLTIQTVSHAGSNAGSSSRLTRSVALLAAKDNASKLAIQVVSCPDASKDNNAGSSKAATRPAVANAGARKAKGKNSVAGEQHETNMGSGSRKGNAALVLDVDHNSHIFTERERRKKMKNMFSTLHTLLPQLPDKADKATIVGEAVIYIKTLERTAEKLEKLKLERKSALAVQRQRQRQRQRVVGAGSSCDASSMRHPTPALPLPTPAPAPSSSREVNLADMAHGWQAQQATANKTLATAAAAAMAGDSSSSTPALPRGAVPFPAPAAGFRTWSGKNLVVSMANNEAYINLRTVRQPGTLTKALFVLERHHIEVVTTTISTQDGFRMYGIHARANPASASARFPENLCAEDRLKLAVSEMLQLLNI